MVFHQLENDYPDALSKEYYLIMIASVSGVACRIENIWIWGKSNGRSNC